ncbi:MAG: HAMP domain-containing histidine kinase [Rhodocyclaceae bacterium]|nr:HAMP domain-containing histidine kinase [Rhodocyclaceae bacterium]
MSTADEFEFDQTRWKSLRYFNLFRLVIAGGFLVAGPTLELGAFAPAVFRVAAGVYLAATLLLGFPDAARRLGLNRLVAIQTLIDIVVLSLFLWSSGGYGSGIPILMLVVLAAAGLIAAGRLVLFFAALTSVAVLGENAWRYLYSTGAAEFFAVGLLCVGFFSVAVVSRMLALRARDNEELARQRGAALRRQQALNAHIIRDLPDGVLVVGEDHRLRQLNPRAAELLGGGVENGDDLSLWSAEVAALAAGAEPQVVEVGARALLCRAIGGVGEAGDRLIYMQDFAQIQAQAQQLKLAALGRLTASIAHEVRNPLSAVTHAADLLAEEKRADMRTRLIRIINDNSHRIERLVRDVLALGRREQVLVEALDLKDFLKGFIDEFTVHEHHETALFSVEIAGGETLAFDRAHLNQIMWNLLGNARRYCTGNPASIRLYVEPAANDRITLHIVDDGEGITPEVRRQIFEPFFTTHSKGTGLGLYIARELADANQASLEVGDNAPGGHFCLTGKRQP